MAIFLRGTPQSPLAGQVQIQEAFDAAKPVNYVTRLTRAAHLIAVLTSAMGVSVLIAWAMKIPWLITVRPGMPQMTPLSAAILILMGAALWLAMTGQTSLARFCGGTMIFIGATRILGY